MFGKENACSIIMFAIHVLFMLGMMNRNRCRKAMENKTFVDAFAKMEFVKSEPST